MTVRNALREAACPTEEAASALGGWLVMDGCQLDGMDVVGCSM